MAHNIHAKGVFLRLVKFWVVLAPLGATSLHLCSGGEEVGYPCPDSPPHKEDAPGPTTNGAGGWLGRGAVWFETGSPYRA